MSSALGLYRLQQVDSQIDQIRARLNVIREALENDVELRTAKDGVSASQAAHFSSVNEVKANESEVTSQRTKIEQVEASLYSGAVKNPKELQDLQMEVTSLKKHLSTLEERELESMVRAEETEKLLAEANNKLQNVQSDLKEQNRDLTNESDTLNKDLERLASERKAIIDDISETLRSVYEKLRQQKKGIAVAAMSDNSCSACGTTLTQSQHQSARSADKLYNCPTCGRILYAS